MQFRKQAHVIRPIAALRLAIFLHGCTHWSTVPEPRTLAYQHAKVFRVTLTDGAILVVEQPLIVGDSLVWFDPRRTAVPLAQVSILEAQTKDQVATSLLLLAVLVPIAVFICASETGYYAVC